MEKPKVVTINMTTINNLKTTARYGRFYNADEIDAWIEQEIRKREMLAKVDEIKTIMWLKEHSEGWLQNRAEVMEQQLKEFN